MRDTERNLMQTWATTAWTKVFKGRGQGDSAVEARSDLLVRYHEAVYHYFLLKIHDPHAAQELYSNFALRLIETDRMVKGATPDRGRFRNYLKMALHNMVMDYYRGKKRKGQPLPLDVGQHDVADPEGGNPDADFPPIWRQELLNQAWAALQTQEKKTGQLHYTVLRYQADHPDRKAPQLAEELTARLSRPFTPDSVRQAIHRAREKFATLLLQEVERSLETPTLEELERELIELQLLSFCKRALDHRRGQQQG